MTGHELSVMRCAFLDLEGILPELEPSGERLHPAWKTLQELKEVIDSHNGFSYEALNKDYGIEDSRFIRDMSRPPDWKEKL